MVARGPQRSRTPQPPAEPSAWEPLDRLGALVERYVETHYTPPKRRGRPPAVAHRDDLLRLWQGFTVERGERERGYLSDPGTRAAYLLYYTPTTAATVAAALALGERQGWSLRSPTDEQPLRVLDVGAGGLGASMGLALYLERKQGAPVGPGLAVRAIDATPRVLADGQAVLEAFAPGVAVQTSKADLRDALALDRAGLQRYDVILVANVINELPPLRGDDAPPGLRLVQRLLERHLAPGGVLVVIDPATRPASRRLIDVREHLRLAGALAQPVGPCCHTGPCPLQSPKDWCFFSMPWSRPDVVVACDEATGHARLTLDASWLLLRGAADASQPAHAYRVIGGPMRADALVRRYLCGAEGRVVALAHELGAPAWIARGGRGEAIDLPADAVSSQGRGGEREVRVGKLAIAAGAAGTPGAAPRSSASPRPGGAPSGRTDTSNNGGRTGGGGKGFGKGGTKGGGKGGTKGGTKGPPSRGGGRG